MSDVLAPVRPNSIQAESPFLREEHVALRDQLRRFVRSEIVPHADEWEIDGMVPRAVLRRMGELGFLGVRYPEIYGGSEMDTVATAVLAEELGRSTYGGFAITVLVHTDMASPHLANAGTPAQLARYMPRIISGEIIAAVAVTEPDAGSDVAAMRTTARRDGVEWVLNGRQDLHHQWRPWRRRLRRRQNRPVGQGGRAGSRSSSSRLGPPASPSAARSTSRAGARRTRRSWCSTSAASRRATSSARSTAASTPSCATFRTSASCSARRRWARRRLPWH